MTEKSSLNSTSQPEKGTTATSRTSSSKPSSKSKRKKHRNRKNKSRTAAQRPAVKEYVSKCCSLPAKKPRTGSELGVGRGSKDKDTTQVHGLGGWRCSGCGKPAKVEPRTIVAVDMTNAETKVLEALVVTS